MLFPSDIFFKKRTGMFTAHLLQMYEYENGLYVVKHNIFLLAAYKLFSRLAQDW